MEGGGDITADRDAGSSRRGGDHGVCAISPRRMSVTRIAARIRPEALFKVTDRMFGYPEGCLSHEVGVLTLILPGFGRIAPGYFEPIDGMPASHLTFDAMQL
jgi:hypothetical protein